MFIVCEILPMSQPMVTVYEVIHFMSCSGHTCIGNCSLCFVYFYAGTYLATGVQFF